eukprot:jgi/Hompol1/4379/HPOL_007073-RA
MRKHGVTLWVTEEDEGLQILIAAGADSEAQVQQCAKELSSKQRVTRTLAIPSDILELLQPDSDDHARMSVSLLDIARRIRSEHNVVVEISAGAVKGVEGSTLSIRCEQPKIDAACKFANRLLQELKQNKFSAVVSVLAEHRPHVIGRGGQTIKKIHEETGALLEFVRPNKKSAEPTATETLNIRGASQAIVDAAVARVQKLVTEQAERLERDAQRRVAREQAEKAAAAIVATAAASTSAPSSSNGAKSARIDDDFTPVSSRTGVPGYQGRSGSGQSSSVK